MHQSKFSLADVILVLSTLVFWLICFLSIYFYTVGDIKRSIIQSIVIAVWMGGLAYGAKTLKQTSRNFKTCFVLEKILVSLFIVFAAIFAYSPFSLYFIVSAHKKEIQTKLIASISQAENMFAEYEKYAENRENLYQNKLKSVVYGKNINQSEYLQYFEENGISDEKQIENKMFILHADLFPSNYQEMKTTNSTWLAKSKDAVKKWKPIGVVNVMKKVEQNSKEWLSNLKQISTIREKGEQVEDFTYDLSFDNVKTYFKAIGKPTPFSISLALLLYILMLLSWFVTKRNTKFPGLKVLFGNNEVAENEL